MNSKRILFVTPSGLGHIYPVVPLAWALRVAGHEICVATCGVSVPASVNAGLRTVDVAPGREFRSFRALDNEYRIASEHANDTEMNSPAQEKRVITALGEAMLGGVLNLAKAFRPDIIIHTPAAAAAPLIASKLDVPTVFLGIGLAQTPEFMYKHTYCKMSAACEGLGLAVVRPSIAWIDVAPPSLRMRPSDGIPMRYLPFNGGWTPNQNVQRTERRPLLAVTLGTLVPVVHGDSVVRSIATSLADVEADVVVAYAPTSTEELAGLPKNVRSIGWIALKALCESCDAVIHHGGAGTMLTALDAGLPQIVLPRGADQFFNAAALARRGVGLSPKEFKLDPETVQTLLTSNQFREQAKQVRCEMTSMPCPADLVGSVVGFA